MLVLSRLRDETIMIGDDIEITIVDIRGDKVRLGINAPTRISVHRKEVYEAIRQENTHAARAGSPGTGGADFDLPHLSLPLSAGPPRTKGMCPASAAPAQPNVPRLTPTPPPRQTARQRSLAVPVQPLTPRTRRRDGPPLPPLPALAPSSVEACLGQAESSTA